MHYVATSGILRAFCLLRVVDSISIFDAALSELDCGGKLTGVLPRVIPHSAFNIECIYNNIKSNMHTVSFMIDMWHLDITMTMVN